MRLVLCPETLPSAPAAQQLSLLDQLDAVTPPDPGARPPTVAMLTRLTAALSHPNGEITAGGLSPGAFAALLLGLQVRGLVRIEVATPLITGRGRAVVLAEGGTR